MRIWFIGLSRLLLGGSVLLCTSAHAQLTDLVQTPNTAGVGIAKTLEEQIGEGRGDIDTEGSSFYIIARDPARSIRRGRQLFQRKFTADQGFGPRVNGSSSGDIETNAAFGAGLVDSCAGCHGRPRGSAGFGGVVFTRPDSRDAPHLFGLGLVEMLADEITTELRAIREQALAESADRGEPVVRPLVSKDISYGSITANPDGQVTTNDLQGVDEDLRVRPFFHDGRTFSIRSFIVGALKDEMGLETADPDLSAASRGERVVTPAGLVLDGGLDKIDPPPINDSNEDGDDDGVVNEIDPALVDHLEFYLVNYFKPGVGKQTRRTRRGQRLMDFIGCTECHRRDLAIEQDRRVADVDTVYDPDRGIFNRLFATATTLFTPREDGAQFPLLEPTADRFVVKNIYTDFRRHDLGPGFHERNFDGTITTQFMTEPLWGVGSTPPYGHDGRSINLEEVILRHGGDAQQSRDRYARLRGGQRRAITDFLQTLVLFPPDDTASNLNPGVPGGDPQTQHGSINLGELFQTPDDIGE